MKLAKAIDFPPGYGLDAGRRRAATRQEVFTRDGHRAGHRASALMYLMLVMQFGSFTAPLAGDAVAAAVADRRGAGAAAHAAARST